MTGVRNKQADSKVELRFSVGRVRRLLNHANGCEEHLPMQVGEEGTGPGIVLIADRSVYMASNGKDASSIVDDDRLAWADGMNPGAWEDESALVKKKNELVGEKDDAVFLSAEDVELVIGNAGERDWFRLFVQHDGREMTKVLMLPTCRNEQGLGKKKRRLVRQRSV